MPVRVRHHVNPLSDRYQDPITTPDWASLYADWQKPLHLDIGCARGLFLLEMARQRPDWNFLGVEIRRPLVEQINQISAASGLTNLHVLFGNANRGLGATLATGPATVLQYVTIQFPDPWFKKRHQKRRVVQPELVQDLATALLPGGTVFLQSDVEAVAIAMCERFQAHPAFQVLSPTWLTENPLPVRTERELNTLALGAPVYRQIFTRRPA